MNIVPCRPPFWAYNGHLQTIIAHLIPSPTIKEDGVVFHIPLESDQERIHSTYIKGQTKIVVYLFHGLSGSTQGDYMQRTAIMARKLGHHVFLNNHRGCGEGIGLATGPYHSGRAEDLSKIIEFGKRLLPDHRHVAIGFSLSANALLLLAARMRASVLPDAAIAVNAPIDLNKASQKLTEGLNRIYDKRFLQRLKVHVKKNDPSNFYRLERVRSVMDFDEAYTAPLGGFRDRATYYAECSAKDHLSKIEIPTVMIAASDDPFVSIEDYLDAEVSSKTKLHIEKNGGHIGYLSRKGLTFERWLDGALESYLINFNLT